MYCEGALQGCLTRVCYDDVSEGVREEAYEREFDSEFDWEFDWMYLLPSPRQNCRPSGPSTMTGSPCLACHPRRPGPESSHRHHLND